MKFSHPVMWTKDSVYNTQGVLQEGGPGNFSYYYSLPRLDSPGNLSHKSIKKDTIRLWMLQV